MLGDRDRFATFKADRHSASVILSSKLELRRHRRAKSLPFILGPHGSLGGLESDLAVSAVAKWFIRARAAAA
jgi:hypothetical protein